MAEISGHSFVCHIDSRAEDIAVSDSIIKFFNGKAISFPTIQFEKEDLWGSWWKNCWYLWQVQICSTLHTSAGRCTLRNTTAFTMSDDDSFICNRVAYPGEILLGNPFPKYAGLDVRNFVASLNDKLSSIDYGKWNIEPPGKRSGNLEINLQAEKTMVISDQIPKQAISLLHNMVSNGDFVIQDDENIHYKDVDVGNTDEKNLEMAIEDMLRLAESSLQNLITKQSMKLWRKQWYILHRPCDYRLLKVGPMIIEFERPERPVKVRHRTYCPEQL